MRSFLDRAGRWFLESGIQEPGGGVARYFLAEERANKPVSTEITGYATSLLAYLHHLTGDAGYLERAAATARFLTRQAWDPRLRVFPFEYGPGAQPFAYFFDSGIIVRGLLAAWRATGEGEFLEIALQGGAAMAADFHAGRDFHPILHLPDKEPAGREERWSRSPGCYQLKAALGWHGLGEATGEPRFRELYRRMAEDALAHHARFLPGHTDNTRVMDRLHAYCYFIEGLLPLAAEWQPARTAICTGIRTVASYVREIEGEFARSDVYAQLLRARIYAEAAGAGPADREAAALEARRLAAWQDASDDPRLAGGFWFGAAAQRMLPFMNPVSTAFGLQALAMWEDYRAGRPAPPLHLLV